MIRLLPALCLLGIAGPLAAGEVVFYRCTDADGALTVQNMPCPKGMQQTRKVMQAVEAPPPRPAAAVAPVQPLATAPEPAAEPAAEAAGTAPPAAPPVERPAPPPLFQCATRDNEQYLQEAAEPEARCLPLRTVGLDGNPQAGAGEACEVVRDRCEPVADEGLCAAWKKRLEEAEFRWRFAHPDNAERNRAEFERVRDLVGESSCVDP